MHFIGLRHGQSQYNLKSLCNDDPSCPVDLTEKGKLQARQAAMLLHNENISRIYTSPLPRAIQTAEIVNDQLNLELLVESSLADIRSGFDGRPVNDYMKAIEHDPVHAKVNDGESINEFHERVGSFLNSLSESENDNTLLVTHEEALRVFKAWAEGLEPEQVLWIPFENCKPYMFFSTLT